MEPSQSHMAGSCQKLSELPAALFSVECTLEVSKFDATVVLSFGTWTFCCVKFESRQTSISWCDINFVVRYHFFMFVQASKATLGSTRFGKSAVLFYFLSSISRHADLC